MTKKKETGLTYNQLLTAAKELNEKVGFETPINVKSPKIDALEKALKDAIGTLTDEEIKRGMVDNEELSENVIAVIKYITGKQEQTELPIEKPEKETTKKEVVKKEETSPAISRIEVLEKIISENINAFYEVGTALSEIRDSKLYKETHKTFESYCMEKWNMSRSYAYRMIEAKEVHDELSPDGQQIPLTERQAREIKNMPEKNKEKIKAEIQKEPVTTKKIKKIIHENKPVKKEPEPKKPAVNVNALCDKLRAFVTEQNNNAWDIMSPNEFIEMLQDIIDSVEV